MDTTKKVYIGVSARHIHLSQEHIELLFGKGYTLKVLKQLSQPNQFAAEEVISVIGPKSRIDNIRILGPSRGRSQLEISRTDSFALGIQPPVRDSGDLEGTPGIRVVGPVGEIELQEGVIVASRHIHIHPEEARKWGISNKQWLTVRLDGGRPLILEQVLARVSEQFTLELHIDTDEANAAGVKTGDWAVLVE